MLSQYRLDWLIVLSILMLPGLRAYAGSPPASPTGAAPRPAPSVLESASESPFSSAALKSAAASAPPADLHEGLIRDYKLARVNARVKELLAAARARLATGALVQPPGNCASDQYLEILQLSPKQPEALEGVRRLTAILLDEATRYEAFGDIYNTSYMIIRARMLQPDNPRLAPLQEKLIGLESKPWNLDPRDKARLEHVDLLVGRAHDRLKKLPFDAPAVGDATYWYDAARAVEPNAPGLPSLRSQLIAAYPSAVETERSMKDFHSAGMLMRAARKHGWVSLELRRAANSAPRPLPKPAAEAPAGLP